MTRYILTIILLSFIQITNLNAAVSVIGDTDAATCYNHAKLGYSSRSSIKICLNTLSERPTTEKIILATRVNLGIIYNNGLKPNLALEQFNLALSSDSERAEIFLNQGNSLFLLKDFTGALEKYEDSLEYNIDDISAVYYNKGLVYEKMGNTDQAILFYNKAVSINPGLMSRFDNRIRLDKS